MLIHAQVSIAEQADIPWMYHQVAGDNKVPARLFYALILSESRSLTTLDGDRKVLPWPWPWTINHRGQAHYFPNRTEAFGFAKSLVAQGDKWFDVGLGQVNWRWHEHRFDSLWEAFEPSINLDAAAKHFREQYERPECNRWELAVGCYHRPGQREQDKSIAKQYATRVVSLWQKL